MIGALEAMGQASDFFASLRQASLDFVFVSLTFRQPFVVFRQISFNDRECSLLNCLRASEAEKSASRAQARDCRFARPAQWRRPLGSHVALARRLSRPVCPMRTM